jgi:hypothetical protein
MKYRRYLLALVVACLSPSHSSAAILEDFQFGDADGTLLGAATNSINAANNWFATDADITQSAVLGGNYHIQKQNQELGDAFLQIADVTSGKAWIVADFSGWSFNSAVGVHDFNAAEPEEVRLAFLDNTTGTSGSTITGQVQLQRNTTTGGIDLVGQLTTSGFEIGPLALPLSHPDRFKMVLEIDEDNETFSVYYKDHLGPYTLLGTAPHAAGRNGNSIRFRMNNSFGGGGEYVDIDRIYVTNVNPIPEPTTVSLALLSVAGLLAFRRQSA